MLTGTRRFSLLLRKVRSAKECRRILRQWVLWKETLRQLPAPARSKRKKLLIIRPDDIGDYLLFRNQLGMYKQSSRWRDHSITLLGNAAWKDLFAMLDRETVDEAIWVNKQEYLESAAYRLELWTHLREKGFEIVIAPSRTRPLLIDDLCTLAAAPLYAIGSVNTYVHASWNRESDSLYNGLFRPQNSMIHEFNFNAEFTAWACGIRYDGRRPRIDYRFRTAPAAPYIICFIGANTRSKRWPVRRWIEFIHAYRQSHSGNVVLAGAGMAELHMARTIQDRTDAQSIVGKVSLPEFLHWVNGARAVITNDTMAAHLSASCNRPTVIIANGVNYFRFTEYGSAGTENVGTLYPDVFTRRRKRMGDGQYPYEAAVSADIASIRAASVMRKLEEKLAARDEATDESTGESRYTEMYYL
jgi:Glycosyltransferase family 9 (heptosyltransferase)